MKTSPTLTSHKTLKRGTQATIRADSADDAVSYFRGRFGKTGVLKKSKANNQFVVEER